MKLNKKQKRTATIASMAALLAVVLGMGGQTFAKYISTETATAQATVAKWGVVVSVNADKLFAEKYEDSKIDAVGDDVVSLSAGTNVIAPGSSGEFTVIVTGQPEVASKISVATTGSADVELKGTTGGVGFTYNPVKWTITNNVTSTSEANKTLNDVLTTISSVAGNYVPGVSAAVNFNYTFKWSWDFIDDTTTNNRDTVLGNYSFSNTIIDPNTEDNEEYTSATKDLKINLDIKFEQVQD